MANIKISELNELTQKENNDFLPIVDSSANETKKISVGNLIPSNDKLVHVGANVDEDYRVNVLKSKNLIDTIVSSATVNGITYTVNSDKSITISGTATAQSIFRFTGMMDLTLEAGTYTIKATNKPSNCYLQLWYGPATQLKALNPGVNEDTFNVSTDTAYTNFRGQLVVPSGATVNATVYVMLYKGTEESPYEPYIVPSINVDNEEIYNKGYTLFNQKVSSPTTSLSLNDAYTNYNYLEIYGRTTNNGTFYKKVDTSNAKFTIDVSTPITGSLTIQEYVNLYSMSDNTITCTRYLRNNYANGSANVVSETNGIFIDKVIGYK